MMSEHYYSKTESGWDRQDDDNRVQAKALQKLLDEMPRVDATSGLAEILYTASENSMLGELEGVSLTDALRIHRMVELSQKITLDQIYTIRM